MSSSRLRVNDARDQHAARIRLSAVRRKPRNGKPGIQSHHHRRRERPGLARTRLTVTQSLQQKRAVDCAAIPRQQTASTRILFPFQAGPITRARHPSNPCREGLAAHTQVPPNPRHRVGQVLHGTVEMPRRSHSVLQPPLTEITSRQRYPHGFEREGVQSASIFQGVDAPAPIHNFLTEASAPCLSLSFPGDR
jgi:hypothetical protein